jgi:2-polyprenyl-6-hydroxyphenyl methylase/3-demethylubiquinone-9 3-methyltransferase
MTTQADTAEQPHATTVDPREVDAFSAVADRWWDHNGPFKPLHRLNPVRLRYLRDSLVAHFGINGTTERPLHGLNIADVGCGGGLISEPLARLGATVTGIDASEEAITVARNHAEAGGLAITYRCDAIEALARERRQFDAVVAMEIVEHVADRAAFVEACCACVRPGGLVLLSTLNRTRKSFALAIVGAEYVLRWVPRGTHAWSKFVKPSELARELRDAGAVVDDVTGMAYDPLQDRWRLGKDASVNYLMRAVRTEPG